MTSEVSADLPGVGVFGTGAPTKILIPLLKKEGYRICALWGRTLQEADNTAAELDIPYATNRIDDVLLRNDVNLVLILCPPAQHSTIAVRALGIGKHVSVQSPGGLSQEEALRMVQAAQYYPRLSATLNHGLRFLPAFTRMRSAVRAGYLGQRVTLCDVRLNMGALVGDKYSWLCDEAMGGGVLNLFGAHIIDLLYYLVGEKASRVHGVVRTFSKTTDTIHGIRQINSDDVTSFQMELEGGAFATVTVNSQLSGFQQEVVLCGRDGHLAVRNGDLYGKKGSGGKEELLYADPSISPTSVPPEAISSTILPPLYLQGTVLMFRELARRFQSTEEDSPDSSSLSCSTFEDAQYAQAVIESVRASSRDRRWTKIEWWKN